MVTGIYLSTLLFVIVALFFIMDFYFMRRYDRERADERKGWSWDYTMVDSGPYARVRHPIITSFFALALGVLLINPALTSLGAAVYAFWDFLRAAAQEESALSREVPGYAAYRQRVPRFLPRLSRRP